MYYNGWSHCIRKKKSSLKFDKILTIKVEPFQISYKLSAFHPLNQKVWQKIDVQLIKIKKTFSKLTSKKTQKSKKLRKKSWRNWWRQNNKMNKKNSEILSNREQQVDDRGHFGMSKWYKYKIIWANSSSSSKENKKFGKNWNIFRGVNRYGLAKCRTCVICLLKKITQTYREREKQIHADCCIFFIGM